jgi:hypothetical protein
MPPVSESATGNSSSQTDASATPARSSQTRNSGENEATCFAAPNFSESHFAERRNQFIEK